MSADIPAAPDVKELAALARRFAERKLYDEAVELFQLALRLEPRNMGLRLALAQAKKLQKLSWRYRGKDPREATRDELRRNAIDAAHFLGLAGLYAEKGEDFRSIECLEISRIKDEVIPGSWKLEGRIRYRLQDYDKAAELLTRCLRFDPFDREAAELLGLVQYERKMFAEALAATIDAFLLLTRTDDDQALRLRKRIRTLRQLLGWQNQQVVALFREREDTLHTCFDRLEWRRERFREEFGWLDSAAPVAPGRSPSAPSRLDLAGRLRNSDTWAHLSDEQVFKLSAAVEEETFEKGERIFANGSQGTDLYLVEEGEIAIQRPTAYGTFPLAVLRPGSMFGEVNFLTRGERSGDAVAARTTRVLRFDAGALEQLAEGWNEFGVQLYWGLWHSLAAKLRATNEQLRTFFSVDKQPENFVRLRRAASGSSAGLDVPSTEKAKVFLEQGLTGKELTTLATFSRERRYESGMHVFEEGDEGREMYVVLEGKVLISKFIPGAGEEALAILERGDFFGEMSLIDGELRSADARAHGGPLTVLALDQATLQEMLALDAQASLDFLKLLCRLVAKRLREIDEKVIGWRILSGERSETASA
jgi:CRP-like cAMP-binding protein